MVCRTIRVCCTSLQDCFLWSGRASSLSSEVANSRHFTCCWRPNLLRRTNCALLVLSSKFLVDVSSIAFKEHRYPFPSWTVAIWNLSADELYLPLRYCFTVFCFCACYSAVNIETYCLFWLWKIPTMLVVTKLRLMNL